MTTIHVKDAIGDIQDVIRTAKTASSGVGSLMSTRSGILMSKTEILLSMMCLLTEDVGGRDESI